MLFDLKVGPLTLLDCNLVVDENDSPKFVAPAPIREKFSDTFRSTVDVDRKFIPRAVFDAVAVRMRTNKEQRDPDDEPRCVVRRPRGSL